MVMMFHSSSRCRLSLRERTFFRGAIDDNVTAFDMPVPKPCDQVTPSPRQSFQSWAECTHRQNHTVADDRLLKNLPHRAWPGGDRFLHYLTILLIHSNRRGEYCKNPRATGASPVGLVNRRYNGRSQTHHARNVAPSCVAQDEITDC